MLYGIEWWEYSHILGLYHANTVPRPQLSISKSTGWHTVRHTGYLMHTKDQGHKSLFSTQIGRTTKYSRTMVQVYKSLNAS